MNLFFIIWIIVISALTFALLIWTLIGLIRLHQEIKSVPEDIKIMNKTNVDDFIQSPQWHEHLQNCAGKKHSKCVTINK